MTKDLNYQDYINTTDIPQTEYQLNIQLQNVLKIKNENDAKVQKEKDRVRQIRGKLSTLNRIRSMANLPEYPIERYKDMELNDALKAIDEDMEIAKSKDAERIQAQIRAAPTQSGVPMRLTGLPQNSTTTSKDTDNTPQIMKDPLNSFTKNYTPGVMNLIEKNEKGLSMRSLWLEKQRQAGNFPSLQPREERQSPFQMKTYTPGQKPGLSNLDQKSKKEENSDEYSDEENSDEYSEEEPPKKVPPKKIPPKKIPPKKAPPKKAPPKKVPPNKVPPKKKIDDRKIGQLMRESNSFGTDIHKKIQAKLNSKKGDNSGARIREIHPEIITKYNSVNVIVGKQSLGKTVIALEEIIKISYMNTHHLLIYVTKDGEENDRSWPTLKNMIEMPIILVSEENAQECVDELITAKSLYYRIRRERIKDRISSSQKFDLFSVLQVNNFEKAFLHTIILFDDISNSKLFSSEESFLVNY